MAVIIGVRFKKTGKVYYFDPGQNQLEKGSLVVVETARGIECGEVVIPNSVTSHITRNWRDGQGLYDDAHDNVITRVIDTFGFASSYHGFSTGTAGNGGALTATGDRVPALEGVAMLLAAVAAVLLGIWATRREEGEGA